MDPLLTTFAQDCEDQLAMLEASLLQLETETSTGLRHDHEDDTLHAMRRCLHNIKGAARSVACGVVATIAHTCEDAISRVRQDPSLGLGAPELGALLRSLDLMRGVLAELPNRREALRPDEEAVLAQLQPARLTDSLGGIPIDQFREEARDLVGRFAQGVEELWLAGDEPDVHRTVSKEIAQALHSLKGGAGFLASVGASHAELLSRLVHDLEGHLARLMRNEAGLGDEDRSALSGVADLLFSLVDSVGHDPLPQGLERQASEAIAGVSVSSGASPAGEPEPETRAKSGIGIASPVAPLLELCRQDLTTARGDPKNLDLYNSAQRVLRDARSKLPASGAEPAAELMAVVHEGLDQLRKRLCEPSAVAIDALAECLRAAVSVLADSSADVNVAALSRAVRQALRPSARDSAAPSAPVATQQQGLRVDARKIDLLMGVVGELLIRRSHIRQRMGEFATRLGAGAASESGDEGPTLVQAFADLSDLYSSYDSLFADLRRGLLSLRMVPVSTVFQRFPRVVRDLGQKLGKELRLVSVGQDIEVDKAILDALVDPLTHLVRNAADHGIEPAAERVERGKPNLGTIRLEASQEGSQIIVRVIDDGRGIDPSRLRAKAVEKGFLTAEQAQVLSDREALELVLVPGFSTAHNITEVSGRGVGMDVVKSNLAKAKGSISIQSTVGMGTTFSLRLPLTLAMVDVLTVRVAEEVFAVPLSNIVELVSVPAASVHLLAGGEVFPLRGRMEPLARLGQVLAIPQASRQGAGSLSVLVVEALDRRVGFAIDAWLSRQGVIIRPLGKLLSRAQSIAGATVLGDGRVVPVLDIAELVQKVTATPLAQRAVA